MQVSTLYYFAMTKDTKSRNRADYEETLYRTGVAIKKELKPGLDLLVLKSGAKRFTRLVAIMAAAPERAAELLKPLVDAAAAQEEAGRLVASKKRRLELLSDMTKGMSPEEIQQLLEAARARGE